MLGPTLARAPLPVGKYEGRGAAFTLNGALRFVPFNGIWNHLGNPACAVPAGFDAAGLPLSIQLVGRIGGGRGRRLARPSARGRAAVGGPAPAGLLTA